MIPPELGGKAFHRYSKDQGTVSNRLPGKRHGPHQTTGDACLAQLPLRNYNYILRRKKKSGDSEKENQKN